MVEAEAVAPYRQMIKEKLQNWLKLCSRKVESMIRQEPQHMSISACRQNVMKVLYHTMKMVRFSRQLQIIGMLTMKQLSILFISVMMKSGQMDPM